MSLDPQAPVSDLGEDGLVELLRRRFAPGPGTIGIGDDAASLLSPGRRLVLTTDTLVEGIDFALDYFSGSDLGWKAVAVNVSDLAAMAAEPSCGVATLCLPAETSVGFVVDLIDGIAEASSAWGVELVGGDISRAQQVSLGLALLGHADRPLLRSGAKPGDAILVSGALGGSAGGLHLLRRDPGATGALVDRHRRPQPRLELSRAVRDLGVTAMIDLSDGLIVDLERLLVASGTGCRVDPRLVPIDGGLAELDGFDAARASLFGGEDFELLFTVPPAVVTEVTDAGGRLGVPVTRIGTVTDGRPLLGDTPFDDLEEEGWDHLRNR